MTADTTQAPEGVGLLPCPFDGEPAVLREAMGEHWVACEHCDATSRMVGSSAIAIATWNRRALSALPASGGGVDHGSSAEGADTHRATAGRTAQRLAEAEAELKRLRDAEWSDMTDAELGRCFKAFAEQVETQSEKEWRGDAEMRLGIMNLGLMQAIKMAAESNAETFTYTATGFTVHDEPVGDWQVTVCRAAATPDASPVGTDGSAATGREPNPSEGVEAMREKVAGAVGHDLRRQLSHSFRHMSLDGPTLTLGFSAPSRPDVTISLNPIIDAILSALSKKGLSDGGE